MRNKHNTTADFIREGELQFYRRFVEIYSEKEEEQERGLLREEAQNALQKKGKEEESVSDRLCRIALEEVCRTHIGLAGGKRLLAMFATALREVEAEQEQPEAKGNLPPGSKGRIDEK
jgi:hypothetical protein